jgi:DNA modification methylase
LTVAVEEKLQEISSMDFEKVQIGDCTLYRGDCLEILPTLEPASVDAVVTDPPYLVGAVSIGNARAKSGTWADVNNAAWWFSQWYSQCWHLLNDAGHFATFCNWRSLPMVICAMAQARMQATSCIVWDKEWIGPAAPNAFRPTYEMIVHAAKPNARIVDRGMSDIMQCKWMACHSGSTGHPAEKPLDLAARLIRACSPQVVLDPFCGSGTFLLAAMQLGISAIGIELDPAYFELAKNRLLTAQTCSSQSVPETPQSLPLLHGGNQS